MVARLRSFLRFLASAGEIPSGLDTQIDTPRVYRGEKLPRALPWDTVRALVEAEKHFRRVRGYRDLQHLVGALDALAPPDGVVANVA